MNRLIALVIGFALDLMLGDPHGYPHIVIGIGRMITALEHWLRGVFPISNKDELVGGVCLVLMICSISYGVMYALLLIMYRINTIVGILGESYLVWQCLAMRSLRDESLPVYTAIKAGDLPGAHKAVSMIVGRDTDSLDEQGVTRAAVETIAENTNDGVIAPLIYLAIGGAPLGVLYKAINTMDSMIGYKNEKYLFFGRAAAKLDDAANYLTSRIAALLMVAASFIIGLDGANAWRVFLRDRYNHKSPNSAQTEALCAGALRIRLGGDAYYFGKLVPKPTIGDDLRPIEAEDITRSHKLLYMTTAISFVICIGIIGIVVWH